MPIADLTREQFEDDLLRATIAAGVSGTMLGPRSAGSTLVMLLRDTHRLMSGHRRIQVRGGPGRLTQTMAAAAVGAGAEIRTAARVERIIVRDERVAGVLVDGQEIPAAAMLSSADRRRRPFSICSIPSTSRRTSSRRSAIIERGEPWPRSIWRSPLCRRSGRDRRVHADRTHSHRT